MEPKIYINTSELLGVVIRKTLAFSETTKSEEEIYEFIAGITKDEEVIEAFKNVVSVQ